MTLAGTGRRIPEVASLERPGQHSAGWWLTRIGWAILILLGVAALLRVVAWDAADPLVVWNAFGPIAYTPAWAVLVGAVIGRRLALVLGALVICAAQFAFAAPEFAAARPAPAWAASAEHISVLDGNVNDDNENLSGYAAEIHRLHPDLVTFEEATPGAVSGLEASGALAGLPYRVQVQRFDPWAFLVSSRYRLEHTSIVSMYGRPLAVRTTMMSPAGPLHLLVVHTTAPLPNAWHEWAGQLGRIAALARADAGQHLVILGDFNATWGNRGFRQILSTGLTDGAAARGNALDMTWMQGLPIVPPLVRIDHVLTGAGVAVTKIESVPGPGSDHRALRVTLALSHDGAGQSSKPGRGRA